MRQYSGFGGLKCILNPAQTESDKACWTNSEMNLFPLVADLHKLIRENSSNEQEYKRCFSSLKSSILTAFYTPSEVVEAFIKTRTLSNGININKGFQGLSRVVHTESFVDKDLYGKPGFVFVHGGGVQGMAADLKTMLSADLLCGISDKERCWMEGLERKAANGSQCGEQLQTILVKKDDC